MAILIASLACGVATAFAGYGERTYTDLHPPGWFSSKAASINSHSEVVGYGDSTQGERGFLRSGPEYEEIAYPGWSATRPESVNDLGQVAGSGETGSLPRPRVTRRGS